jgi:hypothetical protein
MCLKGENKDEEEKSTKKKLPQNGKKSKQINNERSETHPPPLVPNDDVFANQ